MASINTFGIPNVGTGILHPKLVNKFVVRIACSFDGSEDIPIERAVELLNALTMQCVSARIPSEDFQSLSRNPIKLAVKEFRPFLSDANLIVEFEDDIANLVQEAIEFLARPDITHLNVMVAKLDGDEGVTEAFYFGSCKLKKITHTELNYSGHSSPNMSGMLSAQMTDTSNEKINISGQFSSGLGSGTVRKSLELLPVYTQRAFFKTPMKLADLTKQLLGI